MGGYRPGVVLLVVGLVINTIGVSLGDGIPQFLLFVVGIAVLLASVFLLARTRSR